MITFSCCVSWVPPDSKLSVVGVKQDVENTPKCTRLTVSLPHDPASYDDGEGRPVCEAAQRHVCMQLPGCRPGWPPRPPRADSGLVWLVLMIMVLLNVIVVVIVALVVVAQVRHHGWGAVQ